MDDRPSLSAALYQANLSRRATLRGGAMLGTGALLAGLPMSGAALANSAEEWPNVSKLIEDYVDSRRLPNVVASLGWGQGDPRFIAAGRDSFIAQRNSDGDSLYRIYSMTKPITGMAAMMLVDEGLIALDTPVSEILPAFAEMQVQKTYDGPIAPDELEPAERLITMRHLLTHTSGLSYSIVQQGPIAQAARDAGVVTGMVTRLEQNVLFRGRPVRSLELFADRLATLPLVAQPGTRWSYSVGLDLMGRIIEVVSGQSFDSFLQERIFDPCGMVSTWFQVPENEKFRFTASYFLLAGRMVPIDLPGNSVYLDEPPFPFGGSGLVSSPRDYDRFLRMLAGYGQIDGTRVMSEAAVRMGTSDILPDTLPKEGMFGGTYGYGAGGRVGRGADEGLYGWAGAAGTLGVVNIKTGLRAALYTQFMPADGYPLRDEFEDAVRADVAAKGA